MVTSKKSKILLIMINTIAHFFKIILWIKRRARNVIVYFTFRQLRLFHNEQKFTVVFHFILRNIR